MRISVEGTAERKRDFMGEGGLPGREKGGCSEHMGQPNQLQKNWIMCRKQKAAKGSGNHGGKLPMKILWVRLSGTVCPSQRCKGDQIEEERWLEQPERKVLAAVYCFC